MSEDSSDNLCIVCCKSVQYFSVGECDHPVCFECSTRMRVLYQQKECPICRQIMPLVIFSEKRRPFKEINHNDYHFDDSAKISFENEKIMKAYYDLQTIKCPKCRSSNQPSFLDFKTLQTHVKDEHNLFYCDLCLKHLTIFPFERRCYSRSELATHNKQGDKNDRSHKGHALCQFCNERFFDVDLLYRHLRKDHLFCHFCDADGHNKFYSSYSYLREHFQRKHYLCEEGDCRNEQFTNAFRTDIDLKAHKVNTHGKNLGKQAYREARIVDLQLNYKPRSQSDSRNQSASHSSRSHEGTLSGGSVSERARERERERERELVVVDYSEFPSLAGSSSSIAAPVYRKFPERNFAQNKFSMAKENFPALGGVAKENFPALGAAKENNPSSGVDSSLKPMPASTVHERQKASAATNASCGTIRSLKSTEVAQLANEGAVQSQWGSSRRTEHSQPVVEKPKPVRKTRGEDFPTLGAASSNPVAKQKKPSKPSERNGAGSIRQPNKIKVKNKSEPENSADKSKLDKSKKKQNRKDATSDGACETAKLNELPSENNKNSVNSRSNKSTVNNGKINGTRAVDDSTSNISGTTKIVVNERMNKKNSSNSNVSDNSRERPALNNKNSGSSQAVNLKNSANSVAVNNNTGRKNKNTILNDRNFPSLTNSHTEQNQTNGNESNKKQKHKSSSARAEPKIKSVPPGFESQARPATATGNCSAKVALHPPPGFTPLNSLNSINSPFYNQNYSYTFPPNFQDRNLTLERTCRNIFERNNKSFQDFVQESELFISGILSAETYLKSVSKLLGVDQLHTVFPELIVLLPNIQKQKELLSAYERICKKPGKDLKSNACAMCGQILGAMDKEAHASAHILNMNFPPL